MVMTNVLSEGQAPHRFTPVFLRVVGLWFLVGAVFKLFWGTPADLPLPVQDAGAWMGLGLAFRVVIAVELCLAALALLRPQVAWPLLAVALLAFVGVLVAQIADGSPSCGCFGSRLDVPPWAMLAVDGLLLTVLLLLGPWRGVPGRSAPLLAVLVALAVCIALPWVLNREGGSGPGRAWIDLKIATWVGKDIHETEIAPWVDLEVLPMDGLWVLYRDSCEYCAEHLRKLSYREQGDREVLLIRLPEIFADAKKVVSVLPEGPHVHHLALRADMDWPLSAPAEVVLEEGRVVGAREGIDPFAEEDD